MQMWRPFGLLRKCDVCYAKFMSVPFLQSPPKNYPWRLRICCRLLLNWQNMTVPLLDWAVAGSFICLWRIGSQNDGTSRTKVSAPDHRHCTWHAHHLLYSLGHIMSLFLQLQNVDAFTCFPNFLWSPIPWDNSLRSPNRTAVLELASLTH